MNRANTTKGEGVSIAAIIFSKDRAMQLDCLLRSIEKNMPIFEPKLIVYKATTATSKANYDKIYHDHPDTMFSEDVNFWNVTLLSIAFAEGIRCTHVCFFVDDDIIYNPVNKSTVYEALSDDDIDILSIRLTDQSKAKHKRYKGSLDGNIYPIEMLAELQDKNFENPNKLEIQLCKIAENYRMAHLKEQKLISIPHNTVSDTSTCSNMGGCTTKLDIMFDNGYRIDFENMELGSNEPHQEIEYKFYNVNTVEAR